MPDVERRKFAKRAMDAVVRLYPRPFRERFGEQFRQTFSDLLDDLTDQGRNILLITVASLYDAFIGLGREWAKLMLTTNFRTEMTTRIALALFVPFVFLVCISLASGTVLNAQLLSLMTIDGQQLNGLGRAVVFGSVLLLPVSFVINLAGSIQRRDGALTFGLTASSVSLTAVQTVALLTVGTWMIADAVSCSRGVCD